MGWRESRRIGVLAALVVLLAGCAAAGPGALPHDPEPHEPGQAMAGHPPPPTAVMLSDAPTSTPTRTVPDPDAALTDRFDVAVEDLATTAADQAGVVTTAAEAVEPAGEQSARAPVRSAMAVAGDLPSNGPLAAPAVPTVAEQAVGGSSAPDSVVGGETLEETSAQIAPRPPVPPLPTDGLSRLVTGNNDGRAEVALTFDAGADRGFAEEILDVLHAEGVASTFGITGAWAEANPDLVQRIVAEGHQLINHTWTHQSLTGVNGGKPPMGYWQLVDELARTDGIVLELTGYQMAPYFRPPYGDYDATTLGWLSDLGYPFTIMWTCDTKAWAGLTGAEVVDRCAQALLPEDNIVLMHVGFEAAGDLEALPSLIALYRQNGYAFVTAEQMLQP